MRFRPETSISERQLVLALAANGRHVSLDELVAWRKDGLLPPLASHGKRAAGRCYYWREPDIQAQAETVHDSLQKHGRRDAAAIGLWLRGFEVPLPRLRRAWLHRAKRNAAPRIRKVTAKVQPIRTGGLSDLLHSAIRCAAGSIEPGPTRTALAVLERAAMALGLAIENHGETEAQWRVAMAILLLLDSSDAVSAASDAELMEAQRHLHAVLTFLSDFGGNESVDNIIDALGPPIFLFMMTLLRSGQRGVLEAVIDRMDRMAGARREPAASYDKQPHAMV